MNEPRLRIVSASSLNYGLVSFCFTSASEKGQQRTSIIHMIMFWGISNSDEKKGSSIYHPPFTSCDAATDRHESHYRILLTMTAIKLLAGERRPDSPPHDEGA